MGGEVWDECISFKNADILDRSDAILCCRMLHEVVRSDVKKRRGDDSACAFISGCARSIDDATAYATIMIRRLFPCREMRIITTIDHHDAVAAWRMSGSSDGVIVDTASSLMHRMMVATVADASPGRTWAVRSADGVIRVAVVMGMSDPLPGVKSERSHDCSDMVVEAFLIMDELPEEGSRWPRDVIIVCDDPGAFAKMIDPSSNPPIHHDSLEAASTEFPDAAITNHRVSVERPLRHHHHDPRIVVYWHVGALDGIVSPLIFNDQQHVLRCSGIMSAVERLCVGFVGPAYNEEWRVHPRFRVLFHEPDPFCYEMPTLNAMLRDVQATNDDYLILYFHTKGASSMMKHNRKAVNRWRKIMEWWNIVMFRRCVRLMLSNDLDALGGNLINMSPGGSDLSEFRVNPDHSCHYSGNFWWSRASHIRRLPHLDFPTNDRQRLKAENWVLSPLPHMRAGEAFRYQKVHMYDYIQSYTTASTGSNHFRLLCHEN